MKYLYPALVCMLLAACSSTVTDLPNFDEEAWKEDFNGCDGQRLNMTASLSKSLELLKGLNQNDLTALLGKPDRHELYKRSQKFFYYQISPHKTCEGIYNNEDIYLSIRFNATGLAKEVMLMNYQE